MRLLPSSFILLLNPPGSLSAWVGSSANKKQTTTTRTTPTSSTSCQQRTKRTLPPSSTRTTLYSSLENALFGAPISNRIIDDKTADAISKLNPLRGKVHALAVDYGERKTGLATSSGYSPRPLTIVETTDAAYLISKILQCSYQEGASRILVGLPLLKDGSENPQTELVRTFANALTRSALERFGPTMKVILWDERYTSQEAAARVHNLDPNRNLYGTLDADAACILLEDFFSANGSGGETVELDESTYNECLQVYKKAQEVEMAKKEAARAERLDADPFEKRREAIERTRLLEQQMRSNGMLGLSKKSKKKRKKKKQQKERTDTL